MSMSKHSAANLHEISDGVVSITDELNVSVHDME
jgi:hypothetical protein